MSIGAVMVLSGWTYASACSLADSTELSIVKGRKIGYALTLLGLATECAFSFLGL